MVALRKIDRRDWMKLFTHIIVILMLFVLPEIIFNYTRPPWKSAPVETVWVYVKAAVYVGVFYVDYYFILNHTILSPRRRIWQFLGWNVLLIIGTLILLYCLQALASGVGPGHMTDGLFGPDPMPNGFRPPRNPQAGPQGGPQGGMNPSTMRAVSFFTRESVMLVLIIALSVALRLGEKWSSIEKRHEQMLASQKTEELASLKSQLNPHFMFNTLNTIYALIAISPFKAQEAVLQLSTLLRYVLYENPARVKLNQEINFAKSYIALMEMRMGSNPISATFSEGPVTNVEVAPLLFISLIENAFKHGVTGDHDQPIEIAITANSDGEVVCRTSNYFLPKSTLTSDEVEAEKPKGGIGIVNLKRRLQLIYGSAASLETRTEGDKYIAILTIQTQDCK